MGAGMKWTQRTELNGAGWEGLASPWMKRSEWVSDGRMGGKKKEREGGRKGADCKGCVQQQKSAAPKLCSAELEEEDEEGKEEEGGR